jgi:hypothetical protein
MTSTTGLATPLLLALGCSAVGRPSFSQPDSLTLAANERTESFLSHNVPTAKQGGLA